jgi:hypothetical protein
VAAGTEPGPPGKPLDPPHDRMEILARVRRGEITVSEAVELLGGDRSK